MYNSQPNLLILNIVRIHIPVTFCKKKKTTRFVSFVKQRQSCQFIYRTQSIFCLFLHIIMSVLVALSSKPNYLLP